MEQKKVALVTGSGTGIGRACAIRFAKLGFNVVVNYSRSETEANETLKLVRDEGVTGLLFKCNIGDDAEVRQMMATVEEKMGGLDVLVNNAAMTHFVAHRNLEEMTEEKWDQILQVNLKGTFFCIRAATPLLMKRPGANIVSISSVAGMTGDGSCLAYAASKGAVNTMTKTLARALAPEIRVNAVCPGPVDSRWLRAVFTDHRLQELTSSYPIPRPSQPDDIADAVIYLATGTTLTTGQCLVVDGGRTM